MSSKPVSVSSLTPLSDSHQIPVLGFGAYEMESNQTYEAVSWALEIGYRHFEAVQSFENEKAVGKAIQHFIERSRVPRSEIFYASKVMENKGYQPTLESIARAVRECELQYIDLMSLASPAGGTKLLKESWQAMVDAKSASSVKSIGVGNFDIQDLQEILEIGSPAVNQIELHPFNQRKDVVAFCHEKKIKVEAWRPLARGKKFGNKTIVNMAEKYKKEEAQIYLRWSIQKDFIPITMSGSQKRLIYDARIFDFELTDEDMKDLDALQVDKGFSADSADND